MEWDGDPEPLTSLTSCSCLFHVFFCVNYKEPSATKTSTGSRMQRWYAVQAKGGLPEWQTCEKCLAPVPGR